MTSVLPRRISLAGGLLAVVACAPGPFAATVEGHPLVLRSAVVANGLLVFSDRADACDLLVAGREPKEATFLVVALSSSSRGADGNLPTGRYAPENGGAGTLQATFGLTGASCEDVLKAPALGSSAVLLNEVSSSSIKGELLLSFARGAVTGAFEAVPCEGAKTEATCEGP